MNRPAYGNTETNHTVNIKPIAKLFKNEITHPKTGCGGLVGFTQ